MPPRPVPAALEVQGLTLRANGHVLVRDLRWSVKQGEIWSLMGVNGVGKSTLLRALAGLPLPPGQEDSGGSPWKGHPAVSWNGRPQPLWPAMDAARVRAFMPQQSQDRFSIRVESLLRVSSQHSHAEGRHRLLRDLDLEGLARRSVCDLSGGERQRVALAQVASQDVGIWLLDEPASFQDPLHQVLVGRWLKARAGDKAVVMSAHDVTWISRVATHVLALLPGRLGGWVAGTADDMLSSTRLSEIFGGQWGAAGMVWD